jgi:hypothetical protein
MKMKKSFIFAFAILLLVVNGVYVSAITGSMGNAKMILYPEVNGWTNTVVEKSILVKNVNDVPINITLVRDENATKFIDLIDETFILEPGEERKAMFDVKVRKEGKYEGSINVFFRPVEGKEPGVVLSSTIIAIAKKQSDYEEPVDEENDANETTTGDVVNDGNTVKVPNWIKGWGISTTILIIALLILLYIWGKKRNQSKLRKKRK